MLETVTVDLFIIRTLGLFLRRFPTITRVGTCCWAASNSPPKRALGWSASWPPASLERWPLPHLTVFVNSASMQRADVVSLLDEWAARFFEELDYVREGNNATIFAEQIKDDLPQVRGLFCILR